MLASLLNGFCFGRIHTLKHIFNAIFGLWWLRILGNRNFYLEIDQLVAKGGLISLRFVVGLC